MSKPKYDTFNDLVSKQDTFNDYDRSVVQPLLGLSQSELDRLSFADRAKRIDDEVIRGRYCNLAIEMLEANISHYKHEATIKPFPVKNMTSVIVFTFVAAAIGYYIDGFGAAFLCAGLSYWLMDIRANSVLKEGMAAVKTHNELATGWANSLKEWNDDRYELISAI